MSEPEAQLKPSLNLTHAISLVVGAIIGTGVFLKAAPMAQLLGSAGSVLAAWLAAGLLSLAGALTYAELGALYPEAGGDYVFLRKAYGELPAFLFAWMSLFIASTGVIAALGVAFATFASALTPLGASWAAKDLTVVGQHFHWEFGLRQLVAIAVILSLSAINCAGVVLGARLQVALTIIKLAGIGLIAFATFVLSGGSGAWTELVRPGSIGHFTASGFGAAMMSALWAYNGWYCIPMVASEIKDPRRNVPRALILGMGIVIVVYLIANAGYFHALPLADVVTASSSSHPDAPAVAAKAVGESLGRFGTRVLSMLFVVSVLGALNGIIMATARIPFAAARDGLLPKPLAVVSGRTNVPVRTIVLQAIWASLLALSGTFDQLTTYVIFASWIFYGATGSTVFVLRKRYPRADRPYRTLGYPVVPLLFVIVAAWLVVNALATTPLESMVGLLLLALGLPYYIWIKQRRRANTSCS
jgi:APA family basic amino acid/polyamine antiporter